MDLNRFTAENRKDHWFSRRVPVPISQYFRVPRFARPVRLRLHSSDAVRLFPQAPLANSRAPPARFGALSQKGTSSMS
jgi:hypothetical protein